MAALALRRVGVMFDEVMRRRVALVAEADRFARGPWPGPRPLPTGEHPFDFDGENDELALAAIAGAIADHTLAIADRVSFAARWLVNGEEPAAYCDAWRVQRRRTTEMLANATLTIEAVADGRLGIVVGATSQAVSLGYRLAPVVVALNERFRLNGGPEHRKYTVAQYAPGYVDMAALCHALSQRESGWGGTPTVIGSPQGTGSHLELEKVTNFAELYLFSRPKKRRGKTNLLQVAPPF